MWYNSQNASDTACERVANNYEKETGESLLPCDPCYDVTCYNGESCVDGTCQCGGVQCTEHQDCKDGQCVDPCKSLADTAECPCNYEAVPKTTDCWGPCPECLGDPTFTPCENTGCQFFGGDTCTLNQHNATSISNLYTEYNAEALNYECSVRNLPTSCDFGGIQENTYLTPEEVSTCLCRLAQYANELSQVDDGIIVEPTQSTPYSCEPTPAP